MKLARPWYLLTGGLLVAAVLGVALFAESITHVSPHYWDATASVLDGSPPFPPGPLHPLGTDQYGRDVWSRLAFGARWSLLFAWLIMAARLMMALPAAMAGAFGPRRLSWLIDKLYVLTTAVPPLLVYLLLLSPRPLRLIGLWPSVVLTVAVMTLVEWPRLAVTIKGRIEQLATEPFVEGAVAAGGTRWHIFWCHLVPHLWPTLLQLMAAEMARGLLAIAQLAIFDVLVGGGVVNIVDRKGNSVYLLTTGIPEWGNLLSDSRPYLMLSPWIPLAPAFAFLIGVVGFQLLSQGLEGLVISTGRWKEATTGRLHRRWRWAPVLLAVPAALWYYQGLPWTRAAGIAELTRSQASALQARDVAGYLATLRPATPSGLTDARLWAEQLSRSEFDTVKIQARQVAVQGHKATAVLIVELGNRDNPEDILTLARKTTLERRWGRWFEIGEPYQTMRGFAVDVDSLYDPIDPTGTAVSQRWAVQYVATMADRAYGQVAAAFGEQAGERPRIRLYPTHSAFLQALGPDVPPDTTVWYRPGEALRLSPDYLQGFKRWETERRLGYEMVKFRSAAAPGTGTMDPLILGAFELQQAGDGPYTIDLDRLANQPLLSLSDLFSARFEQMRGAHQELYFTQAALLVEWRQKAHPGAAPDQLSAREYDEYVRKRLAGESVLSIPAARARIPAELLTAMAARAEAAQAGDADRFLTFCEPARCDGHRTWLQQARQAGLTRYETTLLVWDESESRAHVLESLTLRDGRVVTGVVTQTWTQWDGAWLTAHVSSPMIP